MIKSQELKLGQVRVLETNINLFICINKWIRVLVTSINVIHSWGIPSLALKVDGIPGILNLVLLYFLSFVY